MLQRLFRPRRPDPSPLARLARGSSHRRHDLRRHARGRFSQRVFFAGIRSQRQRHLQPRRDRLDHPRQDRLDFASNTAYGPLIGHFESRPTPATASTTPATAGPPHQGYLTWAGITAGKARLVLLVHRRRRQLGELLLARPARASTSRSSWPTPRRSAAASRRRSPRKAPARTGTAAARR